MDCKKVGKLILGLRKESKMTQKQLAEAMNISDKTISKWERGMGCPDVSLLRELSGVLGINIERILLGDLEPNDTDGGNMKKVKFYVCPNCGNTLTATGVNG
jgi:transcriptional regulator with XRE-family HTH domain